MNREIKVLSENKLPPVGRGILIVCGDEIQHPTDFFTDKFSPKQEAEYGE